MGEVSTIGIDIAKSLFQLRGVDTDGAVVIRKRIGRTKILKFFTDLPPYLISMEACATSHRWARELKTLGHDVRLMPPIYVKAYVKRSMRLRSARRSRDHQCALCQSRAPSSKAR
jgi:transposase